MKTKSEILKSHLYTPDTDDMGEIYEAMDEYAQQTAMEFAEWIELNEWTRSLRRDLINWYQEGNAMLDKPFKHATTAELFAKFEAERGHGNE